MSRDDGAGAGSILLAFLMGAVSGAAALAQKGRQAIDEGREKAVALAEKGRQAINQGRETLTTAIERGREAYQQARARENA